MTKKYTRLERRLISEREVGFVDYQDGEYVDRKSINRSHEDHTPPALNPIKKQYHDRGFHPQSRVPFFGRVSLSNGYCVFRKGALDDLQHFDQMQLDSALLVHRKLTRGIEPSFWAWDEELFMKQIMGKLVSADIDNTSESQYSQFAYLKFFKSLVTFGYHQFLTDIFRDYLSLEQQEKVIGNLYEKDIEDEKLARIVDQLSPLIPSFEGINRYCKDVVRAPQRNLQFCYEY